MRWHWRQKAREAEAGPLPYVRRDPRLPAATWRDVWATAAVCWYSSGFIVALAFAFGFDFLQRTSGLETDAGMLDAAVISGWYPEIVRNGYFYEPRRRSSVAFFPAYPLLARGIVAVTGMRAEAALLFVSNASFLAALAFLGVYVRSRSSEPTTNLADYTVLVAAFFPTGCFFRLPFSESVFLLLAIVAMLAMARRWPTLATAIVVGAATAARPVGVALLAPFYLHVWRENPSLKLRAIRICVYLPTACWGLLAYIAYQYTAFGEPLAFAKTQRYWRVAPEIPMGEKLLQLLTFQPLRDVFDPKAPAFWATRDLHGTAWLSLHFANPVFFVAAIALLVIGIRRRWLAAGEAAYCGLLLLIPYVTRAYDTGFGSMGRFVLVAFPLYIVLARLLERTPEVLRFVLMSMSAFFLGVYASLFAAGYSVL